MPQHPLVSAQSASCKHFSAIYLTRNYLGTILDVYWIHVYLILILFPPRVLLDILTSLLASYLTPIFVRKSASLITVKHKGPYSELYKYLVVQIILGWCKLYVNHRHFLWLFWITCTFLSAFLYYWYKNPFFFNSFRKFTHQCIYISTSNISYKMQFTYVVNFFESIKMGIHSSENLRLTYDFKLKGMVDVTMFILSNTCVFCRILFGQPFHN